MLSPSDSITLVDLAADHPGFNDRAYRKRRADIAAIARQYRSGDPVPRAPYSEDEHALWRDIVGALTPLIAERAARCHQEEGLVLRMDRLPQLDAVNADLMRRTGFRMEPVEGLVAPRDFLAHLGRRVFLSTQYIRHASRPAYTPEPDIVHELIGHARSLGHPQLASLNEAFGKAVHHASAERVEALIRVYWWTLEFGVLEEGGVPLAFGAGLLSSIEELSTFDTKPTLRPWCLETMAQTAYDPTGPQDHLFVAPDFETMLTDLMQWL